VAVGRKPGDTATAMNEHKTFKRIVFSPDFSAGLGADGEQITFTRAEAETLRVLSERPGRTITRNQLLDAISGEGSDRNDRNIDYLISRIRRKLSDDPRAPKYILTRYGEGYRWLGDAVPDEAPPADILVGPMRGLEKIGSHAAAARRFAEEILGAVSDEMAEGQRAEFAPDAYAPGMAGDQAQSIELTFFLEAGALECIMTTRQPATGAVLAVLRRRLDGKSRDLRNTACDAVKLLLGRTWQSLVAVDAESPLPVAMHAAAGLPVGDNASWDRNDLRLKSLLEQDPDDPVLKLFHATHIHSKYILRGAELFFRREETCREDEAKIEDLVLSALPALREPTHRIMAAKLLFFLDRGYDAPAMELAEHGLRDSTSIASSLAIVGQLRSFDGRPEDAIPGIDQALGLTDFGSEFQVYTLFIKCQALAAAGNWDDLAKARRELYRVRPRTTVFDPLFTDPFRPSFRSRAIVMAFSRERACAYLRFLNYVSTRLFRDPGMRANSVHAILRLLVGRFGDAVVPEELRSSVPDLVDALASRRKRRHG
jgi:DNA-binding winged helix-turn-helix (wHTH) protein